MFLKPVVGYPAKKERVRVCGCCCVDAVVVAEETANSFFDAIRNPPSTRSVLADKKRRGQK